MADPTEDDPKRQVSSGFPDPETVPGPTERLRQLRGEGGSEPLEPRFGRVSVERAGSDDHVDIDDMTAGGLSGATSESLAALGRKIAEETAVRVRDELVREFDRRGLGERARAAGLGVGALGVAGVAGLGMLGALTAGSISLLSRAMPVWAAALTTASAFGVAGTVLVVTGRQQLSEGLRTGVART